MSRTDYYRVLCLDGGGMRGAYTAAYLDAVAKGFAKQRGATSLDVGAGFDLIVGTSTGALIGLALVAGVPIERVVRMYREKGRSIFPRRVPRTLVGVIPDVFMRRSALRAGTAALRAALVEMFGTETVGQVYARRGIALAVPAVEMSRHAAWVFKTAHCPGTKNRDDGQSLVDVCLATSAAPLFRSLAVVHHPDQDGGAPHVFADGGLWANNPVLVGLLDALRASREGQRIQVFSLGTCPLPAGEQVPPSKVHRGLPQWRFGGDAATLSIDAQEFAYDHMARMFAEFVNKTRPCDVLRFPRQAVPAALSKHLSLDDTTPESTNALILQARNDADHANSICGDPNSREGALLCSLFRDIPFIQSQN